MPVLQPAQRALHALQRARMPQLLLPMPPDSKAAALYIASMFRALPFQTIGDIVCHGLELHVYRSRCFATRRLDLELTAALHGRPIATTRFRCRRCGTPGVPKIRPAELLPVGGPVTFAFLWCNTCIWEIGNTSHRLLSMQAYDSRGGPLYIAGMLRPLPFQTIRDIGRHGLELHVYCPGRYSTRRLVDIERWTDRCFATVRFRCSGTRYNGTPCRGTGTPVIRPAELLPVGGAVTLAFRSPPRQPRHPRSRPGEH